VSKRPQRQSHDVSLSDLLAAGARALPSVRYATACVGVAAAVALVLRSTPSAAVAVFGSMVMLAAMVLIALVSRAVTARDPRLRESLRRPIIALVWAVVGASIVVLGLLITTTFWGVPHYYGTAATSRGKVTQASPPASARSPALLAIQEQPLE
jgi:multisubunit Na+/H+ antiporter MnhB subunit